MSRRNLPHWRADRAIYWVTFRLADSLPQTKLNQLKAEKEAWLIRNPAPWTTEQQLDRHARFNARIEEWLDAGYGSCALANSAVRAVVRDCLVRFDGDRLQLHAGVIMPNHVHALIEPRGEARLSYILKGIKGASAYLANRVRNTRGTFWMDESYDRIVRDVEEYVRLCRYIADNPRKARLPADHFWLR